MKALLPVVCSGALAGCAASTILQMDNFVMPAVVGVPIEQASRVVAIADQRGVYSPMFVALYDEAGKEIRKAPLLSVNGTTLVLAPGTYSFSVQCRQDIALKGMRLDAAAGQTYSIWCEPVPWSAPVIRYRAESHTAWEAHRPQA